MKSNLGLIINLKSIKKHSCLIQGNKLFSHGGITVCTYPFLLILACIFVQTIPHHILVKYYVTCYVIRT